MSFKLSLETLKPVVVGLGYVGLPLAVEIGKYFKVLGFDIDKERIQNLNKFQDHTREVSAEQLMLSEGCKFTSDSKKLAQSNFYIVTVPTPIDKNNRPDLVPLEQATKAIGALISEGDIVVYESTVYPGLTEELCVPLIEKISGLKLNKGFFVGYSPERINPGDKKHRLPDIVKVTSGSNLESAEFINKFYSVFISAGTYKASSIKVAESAKVIENVQRDVNIALVNELAVLFGSLDIDTYEVLKAAGTKWNFLPFVPGLVGGHCIGVDPYYLTHKAQEVGHHPELILAGRRTNDKMATYVADSLVLEFVKRKINMNAAKVLILGFTFKEDCPDIRNTKVSDIVNRLKELNLAVDIYDPVASNKEIQKEYGLEALDEIKEGYDAILCAVAHQEFIKNGISSLRLLCKKKGIIYDLKNMFPAEHSDMRL